LTEKRREELFELLSMLPLEIGVGICDHITIDRINILQASFLAMKKAISALKNRPEYILLDGKFRIPNLSLPQKAIISGDDLVFSIAAASIIAKVTRDRMMRKLHSDYPVYGFNKHKGYGTRDHLMALAAHGPSAIHRRSFDPVRQACETIKNKV
jgi:ribonuclease HII